MIHAPPASRPRLPSRQYVFVNDRRERYAFVQELGKGQFGRAMKVKALHTEQHFALKEIVYPFAATKMELIELFREVDIMREMCVHPNIVTYHNSWRESGRLYILMELCSRSLENVIRGLAEKKQRFASNKIVFYVQELAGALRYCHDDLRVMHRDLKPANILLDDTGTLKLADFGLAKALDRTTDLCATFCGSPLYMSPEQCSAASYSFSTDMWALGCILYELMALHSPWMEPLEREPTYPSLVLTIIDTEPNYKSLHDRYPPPLLQLAEWMLLKDPTARATAADVCAHLALRPLPHMMTATRCTSPAVPVESTSYTSGGDTLRRQCNLVDDARVLADAAHVIQRSYRKSASKRAPMAAGVPTRPNAPTAANAPPPPTCPRGEHRIATAGDGGQNVGSKDTPAVLVLQEAFRCSLKRRACARPNGTGMPRIQQLAVPRAQHNTRMKPLRQQNPPPGPPQPPTLPHHSPALPEMGRVRRSPRGMVVPVTPASRPAWM